MSDRVYIGSRKGLFTIERRSSGWGVARVEFLGMPVSAFLQDSRDGSLYAALYHGHFGCKLHRSRGAGQAWEECGVPIYPQGAVVGVAAAGDGQPQTKPASLSEIWALEEGGDDQPDLIWAGTIPGGLFRSADRGATWTLVDSLWNQPERLEWFGGGKDYAGIHSICLNPTNTRHVRVGVSCGGMWETLDGGGTWQCRASGMRADYMPPGLAGTPHIQDVHRLAQSAADPDSLWAQHHNGIFRSTDGGANWRELASPKPSGFGFAVAAHPHDAKTAWFVPGIKDECRVPVDAQLVVSRTRDGGDSFEVLREGLPGEHCYEIVLRHGLDVDESGDRLVMGSSTGGLWISENAGDSWQTVSHTLPPIYCVHFHRDT